MAKIESFRDLVVWQKGMELAEAAHHASDILPRTERFGLGSQLKRAATSVPSNVAEGFSRHAPGAYRNHVAIACGSVAELRTLAELSRRLGYLSEATVKALDALADVVARLLTGLWRALAARAVCYSVLLIALGCGLWPAAIGLFHGFSFHA